MCRPRTAHTLHYPNTKAITETHAHHVLYCTIMPCVPCLCTMFKRVPNCLWKQISSVTTINCYLLPEPPRICFTKSRIPSKTHWLKLCRLAGGRGGGDRLFLKYDSFADKLLATTSVTLWWPAVEVFALWSVDCDTVYPSGKLGDWTSKPFC